ncbi:MAG: enoyl-CoA hydratase/isomerase family protein [Noviherbaspirillum sp.]
MSAHVSSIIKNNIGFITLDRAKALNALSLDMVRALAASLRDWQQDDNVIAVVIRASSERAFCAGGDIRFFHQVGTAGPAGGSALLEDFFTEEYALNHLIHHYPKPYIAFMDGIVMGGGMGVAQGGPQSRLRIVTDKTAMAMPEVHIGLFPDVGGGYFLSRAPGRLGAWLGLTGLTIGAADAIEAGMADVYLPSAALPELLSALESQPLASSADVTALVHAFAAPYAAACSTEGSMLAAHRKEIDRHFGHDSVAAIVASLESDGGAFAEKNLAALRRGSPLLLCVTLEQLRRGADMSVADCLRMERTMVRHSFESTEVLEGIRARVIEKDNAPRWSPATLEEVSEAQVESYFSQVWPAYAHPLRDL